MVSDSEKLQATKGPRERFTDPLGRPLVQGTPRFTDQQAGGDLTGDESDARDGNFNRVGGSQSARDTSAHAEGLPAASAELLRCASTVDKTKRRVDDIAPPPAFLPVSSPVSVEPDGTEDPGANADDGLMPGKETAKPSTPA